MRGFLNLSVVLFLFCNSVTFAGAATVAVPSMTCTPTDPLSKNLKEVSALTCLDRQGNPTIYSIDQTKAGGIQEPKLDPSIQPIAGGIQEP